MEAKYTVGQELNWIGYSRRAPMNLGPVLEIRVAGDEVQYAFENNGFIPENELAAR